MPQSLALPTLRPHAPLPLTLLAKQHMPTILRVDGFRFYFYSHEPNEPPHVHIDKDAATAKVWLHDAAVARSMGFSAQDLSKIQRMVKIHQSSLKEAWNAFFGT